MTIKFNDSNIYVGYIKQLLSSFNLPNCHVFNTEDELKSFYKQCRNGEVLAIVKKFKDNQDCFVRLKNGYGGESTIDFICYYEYGKYYPNLTRSFINKSIIYDEYTHIYLGQYLQFLKEYKNLNLFPLYNCYTNNVLQDEYKNTYIVSSVNYNSKYTFAFNSKIEYAIVDYGSSEDMIDDFNSLENKKVIRASFDNPTVIEVGEPKTFKEASGESNKRFIIKVENGLKNNFYILRGDYATRYSDNVEFNFDDELTEDIPVDSYPVNLSLLSKNKKYLDYSLPFADRLIEYLSENVIVPGEYLSRNIVDAKKKFKIRYMKKQENSYYVTNTHAEYDNKVRAKLTSSLFINQFIKEKPQDILYYVDKDVEFALNDERYPKNT